MTDNDDQTKNKSGMSTLAVVGITIGIIAFIAVIVLGVYLLVDLSETEESTKDIVEIIERGRAEEHMDTKINLCASKCSEKCAALFPAKDDPNRQEMVASCTNSCTMSCVGGGRR